MGSVIAVLGRYLIAILLQTFPILIHTTNTLGGEKVSLKKERPDGVSVLSLDSHHCVVSLGQMLGHGIMAGSNIREGILFENFSKKYRS